MNPPRLAVIWICIQSRNTIGGAVRGCRGHLRRGERRDDWVRAYHAGLV